MQSFASSLRLTVAPPGQGERSATFSGAGVRVRASGVGAGSRPVTIGDVAGSCGAGSGALHAMIDRPPST